MNKTQKKSTGQILVIFGISLMALLFFVGLALDAGSLYITYGHLKRAVDSASIAAANEFKRGANSAAMQNTAAEVMTMMNTDMNGVDLAVYICDENSDDEDTETTDFDGVPDGKRDYFLEEVVPVFYALCPSWENGDAAKKLVWVQATQKAPLYFLSLMGFGNVSLQTHTVSEAAPLDLVIVLDVSESMGEYTPTTFSDGSPNLFPDKSEPNSADGCNENNSCQPLRSAKDAAIALVDTLYDAIDQVAVVTYSNVAVAHPILNKNGESVYMSDDMAKVKEAIGDITLNDDAPLNKLFYDWLDDSEGEQKINFANPEDRDNDGRDIDDDAVLYDGYECPWADHPEVLEDRWWSAPSPICTNMGVPCDLPAAPASLFASGGAFEGWSGIPCDRDDKLDVYDWDGDGIWTEADDQASRNYLLDNDPDGGGPFTATLAPLSTCIGCGIRTGANVLKAAGRYGSVWVMVFLTDGTANLSDTPATNADILNPSAYPNGFCNSVLGGPAGGFWDLSVRCKDTDWTPRYCIDASGTTCPQAPAGADWVMGTYLGGFDSRYSVLDYARDMVDEAALQYPNNPNEPAGEDIAIYSIGLGDTAGVSTKLLRYMALIGMEGRRETKDPCDGKADTTWCGQYYYASGSEDLTPIFEDIASRIFTRISQ
jgi:hypothetical protein